MTTLPPSTSSGQPLSSGQPPRSDKDDASSSDNLDNVAHASHPQPAPDVPPNGGYGWIITLAVFLINFHSWGINSSYGVFLAYYLSHNTYPGATYLEFAFIGGLSISMAMLVAPVATNCTRLFGTKVTLSVGIVLETVALITAGSTYQVWQLFLSQGVAFGFGMGFLFVASVGLVPQWFSTRRSLANGIATAGSGIGALTYNLATNAIIQSISIGWAFRILGILAFAVNAICLILIKDRNAAVGTKTVAIDLTLFKRTEFLMLQAWGFLSLLGYVVVLFSLPDYAKSIGLTPAQGSVISALLNLGQGLGRPPIGYFSDSFGRLNMAAVATLLTGILCLAIWVPSQSYGALITFALLGGSTLGTYWATISVVAAEVVGLPDLPAALSLSWLIDVLPTLFSEPIALEIAQRSSAGYLGAQLFAAFMYIGAAFCLLPVRAWKIQQIESAGQGDAADSDKKSFRKTPFLKALFLPRRV